MTDQVKGVVQKINKGKAYSVLMDDEGWYGAGFDKDKIPFKEGDIISFNVSYNGKFKNIDLASVEVISEGVAEPTKPNAAPKASGGGGGTTSREGYWDEKAKRDLETQKEIRLQASRNAAIAFVTMLLEKDLLKLGSKVNEKVGIVEEAVNHYTHQFYEETVNINNND